MPEITKKKSLKTNNTISCTLYLNLCMMKNAVMIIPQCCRRYKYAHHYSSKLFTSFSTSSQNSRLKFQILKESLKHVNSHGWKSEAISQAINDLKLPPLTHGVIDRGPIELVEFFINEKRQHVQEVMENRNFSIDSNKNSNSRSEDDILSDSIYLAICTHIDFTSPFIRQWAGAMALVMDPRHLDISLPIAYSVIDDLCHLSGLKTSRFDWYTERALLLLVYSSTEFYMLTDNSEDLTETKNYLKRCLDKYVILRRSSMSVHSVLFAIQGFAVQFAMDQLHNQSQRGTSHNSSPDNSTNNNPKYKDNE